MFSVQDATRYIIAIDKQLASILPQTCSQVIAMLVDRRVDELIALVDFCPFARMNQTKVGLCE